ncbi:hypothetical protein TSUD_215800 [Trifolium subterraneum]|uniref:TF-B3 domain-containing protein n=1 Tax=Trifolium subterraneum TaxID=3900 RepID=A0A2Z6N7Z8_TRISU|nr:hypothetical protein TSUD_215800 [Trifolium subterraneum]
MSPKFREDWSVELVQLSFGFLTHSSGNSVVLKFHLNHGECYMTSGKMVALLFEIGEVTEVVFTYKFDADDSCFKMECVKENQVVDLLSGGDDDDGFPVPGDDSYVLYAYQNDRVFGWEMVVSGACADESKNQVLHIPPRTANGVIRDAESIMMRTQHRLDKTRCTIKTYTRKDDMKEMYLTRGWYEFKKANNLIEVDKLQFRVSDPSKIVVVDIVRHSP